MELQLALDGTLDDAMRVLDQVRSCVDRVEIGTPLIYRDGLHVVRRLRTAYPDLTLVADLKIMDAGKVEAALAYDAGADWTTVLGVAADATISGALQSALAAGAGLIIDLIEVLYPLTRARALVDLGARHLCVHTGFDRQAETKPLATLQMLRNALPDASLFVAGGINADTLPALLAFQPAVIIVGSAITAARDPLAAVLQLRERMLTP